MSDSLVKDTVTESLLSIQTDYEKKKSQTEINLLNKNKALQNAEIEKQKLQKYSFVFGFILMIALALVIFRSYRQKRKDNVVLNEQKREIEEKNEELKQQNEEIKSQRDEIEAQRDEIEAQRDTVTKQKGQIEYILHEVHQSIDYAQRIQTTILPEPILLENNFSEYFLLYKPKDKVSGDFYWWAEIEGQIIVTVADCTGHGVPGAFMTMLGSSFLREIVQKEYITDSAVILKKLRNEIIRALKQKGVEGEQKDGMDMALVSINKTTKIMHYAGAHNSLLIVKNPDSLESNNEIVIEIKADKIPVAIYDLMDSFTNNEVQLNYGDMIYMFSDGYVDQFGGSNKKKFLSKNFKKLISEIRYKNMNEQKEILNNTIKDWKGKYEQIDDITVLGLKI